MEQSVVQYVCDHLQDLGINLILSDNNFGKR